MTLGKRRTFMSQSRHMTPLIILNTRGPFDHGKKAYQWPTPWQSWCGDDMRSPRCDVPNLALSPKINLSTLKHLRGINTRLSSFFGFDQNNRCVIIPYYTCPFYTEYWSMYVYKDVKNCQIHHAPPYCPLSIFRWFPFLNKLLFLMTTLMLVCVTDNLEEFSSIDIITFAKKSSLSIFWFMRFLENCGTHIARIASTLNYKKCSFWTNMHPPQRLNRSL